MPDGKGNQGFEVLGCGIIDARRARHLTLLREGTPITSAACPFSLAEMGTAVTQVERECRV
ncbi:MAG: hypothetical protein ACXWQ5_17150 [Ktedonobacterales bacterium]